MTNTTQEKQAARVAKKLVEALLAIENYNGDPEDILQDAEIRMHGEKNSGRRAPGTTIGASQTLQALKKHYLEEGGE